MKRAGMPLRSREVPLRRSSIARVSPKRRVQNVQRRASERYLGREGTQGTCARCGQFGYVNGHERLGRAQGGNPAAPDCLLCVSCNTWCEDFPEAAAWEGWKISRKHSREPSLKPTQAYSLYGTIVKFPFGVGVTTEQAPT